MAMVRSVHGRYCAHGSARAHFTMADPSEHLDLIQPPPPSNDTLPPVSPVGAASTAVRALRKEISERPSAEKLEGYAKHRDEMLKQSRKNGSMHFTARGEGIPCGLINQGATCYLSNVFFFPFSAIN
jgi:hypothetical protein